ncbi:MAG: carboxymuconolactone decarboxylase family protein [Alloprevotella sp.]|nr:carboxymuconolactone decarboxylase family protein [Alloprevotella sp.]
MKNSILILLLMLLPIGLQAQQTTDETMQTTDSRTWPKGEPNTAYAKYFTGNSYLAQMGGTESGLVNVTFEPRCRNNWHIHHGAVQVLICVSGRGWYVEEGKAPLQMTPGCVVAIPAEAKHWHGDAADSWFQLLTYMSRVEPGSTTEWLEPVSDEAYDKLPPYCSPTATACLPLSATDPDFAKILSHFETADVLPQVREQLDDRTRYITHLATLIGCQGSDAYRELLPAAFHAGVTPVEVKEVLYQATAYLGLGRVRPFFDIVNRTLTAHDIQIPLPSQAQTTADNRREAGTQAQVDCFGEGMHEFWQSGPEESRHINRWLAANCFGDYYTRSGLDLRLRELITFCFLAAQGGCEPQLRGHIAGNLHVGNTREFLIAVLSANVLYIGYPRTLNALACVREAEGTE